MTALVGRLREPVSGLTHLFGAFLAIAGLVCLLVGAVTDARSAVAFAVYGSSLVVLLLSSSLYHLLPLSPRGIARLRKIDHAAIFVFIAGSYTPITLMGLGGGWGWSLFGVIWGFALFGVFQSIFWINAPRWLTTGIYLACGWLAVVALWQLFEALTGWGMFFLLSGGVAYSAGAVIYARKRPDPIPGVFGFHEIWHIFVLAGCGLHYAMMWTLV